MDVLIRPGRREDRDQIAAFTEDTFEWGDYVAEVFEDWLADPDGWVLVAEERAGDVIGMAKGTILSPREAWAQGARVHPDHRRRGIGKRLNAALCDWAAGRGAAVIRLVVEHWNEPARRQVLQLDYRGVADWVMADRSLTDEAPRPAGDGGLRIPRRERLQPAARGDVEPAYLAWAGGELATAGRELYPLRWTWRRFQIEDLVQATLGRALWEGRSGWAIGRIEGNTFDVSWLALAPEDAPDLVGALLAHGLESGVDRIELKAPDIDWLREALTASGFELHPMTVFAKPLRPTS